MSIYPRLKIAAAASLVAVASLTAVPAVAHAAKPSSVETVVDAKVAWKEALKARAAAREALVAAQNQLKVAEQASRTAQVKIEALTLASDQASNAAAKGASAVAEAGVKVSELNASLVTARADKSARNKAYGVALTDSRRAAAAHIAANDLRVSQNKACAPVSDACKVPGGVKASKAEVAKYLKGLQDATRKARAAADAAITLAGKASVAFQDATDKVTALVTDLGKATSAKSAAEAKSAALNELAANAKADLDKARAGTTAAAAGVDAAAAGVDAATKSFRNASRDVREAKAAYKQAVKASRS